MAKIIVGFSKSKSLWKIGSAIIRKTEKRDYSHVYVRYSDPLTNLNIVSQASHGMVNEMVLEIFQNHNDIIKEYNLILNDKQFIDIITFLKKNLGKPYSRLQLFFIGIKKLFHFEVNITNKDDSFICSELGARVCQILGVKIEDNLDYITPSDIDALLTKGGLVYG